MFRGTKWRAGRTAGLLQINGVRRSVSARGLPSRCFNHKSVAAHEWTDSRAGSPGHRQAVARFPLAALFVETQLGAEDPAVNVREL